MATFQSSLKPRLIYIFAINDEWHKDCLKIGETTLDDDHGDFLAPNSDGLQKAARKRIDQYTKTAGIAYQLLYTELTIYINGGTVASFNDKQVHSVLERSGIKKKVFDTVKGANEWYCCDLDTAKKAIKAVKNGQTSLRQEDVTISQTPIIFRPEQTDAIQKTIKQFCSGNQMLWNAKMRFGKTLSALQVVKEKEFARTLILTHRPVVDDGWFEDLIIIMALETRENSLLYLRTWQGKARNLFILHLCKTSVVLIWWEGSSTKTLLCSKQRGIF